MQLSGVRGEIDKIDEQIVKLLAVRMELSSQLCFIKELVKDEQREKEILERVREIATRENLDKDFAEDMFKRIINHSCKIQNDAKDQHND